MARTTGLRFLRVSLSVVGVQLAGAATLGAQALVPPAGEGTVSITYQNYYVTGHFDPAGRRTRNGGTHTKAVVTELEYAVTDTIGLSVSLPFIASKYTGSSSYIVRGFETFPGPLDGAPRTGNRPITARWQEAPDRPDDGTGPGLTPRSGPATSRVAIVPLHD